MKVLFIPANGDPAFTEIGNELADMQSLVGGYIEVVGLGRLRSDLHMVIDEEGKLKEKPLNRFASKLYSSPWDVIVGDAFICKEDLVNGEPDLVGLEAADCAFLTRELYLDTF